MSEKPSRSSKANLFLYAGLGILVSFILDPSALDFSGRGTLYTLSFLATVLILGVPICLLIYAAIRLKKAAAKIDAEAPKKVPSRTSVSRSYPAKKRGSKRTPKAK